MLAVSVPSHCELMRPAVERLAQRIMNITWHTPSLPVYHNTIAAPLSEPAAIANILLEQLVKPVRWAATLQPLAAQGITHVLEFGPGKVLVGMMKRIDKTLTSLPVYDSESLDSALQAVVG